MVNPWLTDVATRLPRYGWEPLVITLAPEGDLHVRLRAEGIRSIALGGRSRPEHALALGRLIAEAHGASLVHAHLLDAVVLGVVAGTLARRPVVVTRHESPGSIELAPIGRLKRRVFQAVDGLLLRSSSAVIVPSDLASEEVVRLGADPSKVHKILLGADMRRLAVADRSKAEGLRRQLAPGGGPMALFVGRFSAEKRVDVLLRSWSRVSAVDPGATLVLVGTGPERDRLTSLASELGIGHTVVFAGWRTDVPELMLATDVVVHPSATESTGIVLLEALALARPLVVTPVGIVNEYLVDGVHCDVVPHADAQALARAIAGVFSSPDAAAAKARAGRRAVMERSAVEPMVAAYARLYDDMTRRARRSGIAADRA